VSEQNKATIRRAYELINTGNLDAFSEVMSNDIVDHNAAPGQPAGIQGIRQTIGMFRAAFPDFHVKADDMLTDGNKVMARLTATGTHKGQFMGIPPTGKAFKMEGMEIFRVANGKVVDRWGVLDQMGMMTQLGLIPSSQ
jgi:steroid delta-isomerase-like uncharacterized protein